MKTKKSFASDNWSGVCPEIMQALAEVNRGHNPAYGELGDPVNEQAIAQFREHFGDDISVFFVYNGTAANVLGVSQLMRSYHAVVSAKTAHLNEDECAAPEKFMGSKILEIESRDGKIKAAQIEPLLKSIGFQHHAQPRVISISQVTEMGTVYTADEIRELAGFAHRNNMFLHLDGARIANAVAALNTDFKSMTTDAGVDVLSFGGTKNGLMFGETVVFFNKNRAKDFEYLRKQGMQLHSKMRYISAQFHRYLSDGLWKKNALAANKMAQNLARALSPFSSLQITQDVKANGVFVLMPEKLITALQKEYFFHLWNESPEGEAGRKEVRLMCSWDTTEADIEGFVEALKQNLI
ncbi:MAG: aminotransferase class I/II-fold pyridoxal phosphate-dependent enzyme [Bacteroidales bacterium]|nr:aminotransferase class I/II-fold pyridoxal phosphate-dependent enzyme [Bacteroidales bacterium]